MLDISHVSKWYRAPGGRLEVLRGASLHLDRGELLGIVGESGSGKTTLLRILGALVSPSSGQLILDGRPIPVPASAAGARFRNEKVGFVLQDFGLIDDDTAAANVALAVRYRARSVKASVRNGLVAEMLQRFGLQERAHARAGTLSGGERQRVAIARAIINDPGLILADEPTGALDAANGQMVLSELRNLAASGKGVIVVTHDPAVAQACDRVLRCRDGVLSPT